MANDVQVIEDGVTDAPEKGGSKSSWFLGVVGFTLGLGLGVLVVGPTPETLPETTPTTLPFGDVGTETTVPVEDLGVAAVIPEFPDAIVGIARTSGTALNHVLWPSEGDVTVRSMTGGEKVILDVASQFIAMSDGVPGLNGALLSMGRFSSIQPVAPRVLSYAWHDSDGARLAFTSLAGEQTRLFMVKADLSPQRVADLPSSGATVAGWGDWGWAVQQNPDEIVLLNPEGQFKDSEPGVALATHRSGWVFSVEDGEAKLISAGGGVRRLSTSPGVGNVTGATFSPDGSQVAVVGSSGLAVLDVESQEVRGLSPFSTTTAAWSSDSRFVIIPTVSGAVVFDLENSEEPYRVLRNHSLLAVGVVRLRSS